ncbi:MAG: phosphoenolpyruvate carboxykinase domain-containing protein, partial [Desulfotomaculaceae bacterium]|nr:phosphoenolpyruvate carboxykinase domain-containing protein [Desulfotomaculaceae bacterium]
CEGRGEANESPIGYIPKANALNMEGLDLAPGTVEYLLGVEREIWIEELNGLVPFFKKFGERLPKEIMDEHQAALKRLNR